MFKSEIFVNVGSCDLSACNSLDNCSRSCHAVSAGEHTISSFNITCIKSADTSASFDFDPFSVKNTGINTLTNGNYDLITVKFNFRC